MRVKKIFNMALNPQQFELLKQRLQRVRDSGEYVRNPITGATIRVETPADIMRGGQPQAPATQALSVARGGAAREPRQGNILTRTLDTASKGLIGLAGSIAPVYKDIGYDIAKLLTLKDMAKLEVNQQALFSKVMERLKDPSIPDYRKQQYVAMFKRINPDLISGVPEFNRTALQRVGAMVQTAVAPAFAGRLPATVAGTFAKGAILGELSGTAERVSEGKDVGRAAVGAIPGALVSGGLFAGIRALSGAKTLQEGIPEAGRKAKEFALSRSQAGGKKIVETLAGTPEQQALGEAVKPTQASKIRQFIQGKRTFETLANETKKAVKVASDKSYKAFQEVVDATPQIKIGKSTYLSTVRNTVKDLFGVEKGVKFTTENLRELNPTEIGFGEAESKLTMKLIGRVLGLKDELRHAKGVLQLRQSLDRFPYGVKGEGYDNYNRIFNAIRSSLNKMATDKYKPIGEALRKASQEIRLQEQFQFNLIGAQELSAEQSAIKLEQVSRKITDPLVRRATLKLIQQLRQRTGFDLESELRAVSAARAINPPLPGIESPLKLVEKMLVRGAGKAAIGVGRMRSGETGQRAKNFFLKPR